MNARNDAPQVSVELAIELVDDSGNVRRLLDGFPAVNSLRARDEVRIEGVDGTFEGPYQVVSVRHTFHRQNGYKQCILVKVQPA